MDFKIVFITGLSLGTALGMIIHEIYSKFQAHGRRKWFASTNTKDPKNQLRFLENAPLRRSILMNREAYKRFQSIEEYLKRSDFRFYRVVPETCMSVFITLPRKAQIAHTRDQIESGFRCKRVDFLIINEKGLPVLAIEYHGSGHYQGDYEARDKVKEYTLNIAGIPLLVLDDTTTTEAIITRVNQELSKQRRQYR